jgi:hypothetical protein
MRFGILAIAPSAFNGLACAGVSSMPLTGAALEEKAVFYVEHQIKDDRNLHLITNGVLQARGLNASTGIEAARSADVKYIVTYEDRWAWDMRTYLREIKIEVQRANSSLTVAMSESHQDSLNAMGEPYEEIVAATTHRLLDSE